MHGIPSSAPTQRCSESDPRFFCTTRYATPPGASRGNQVRSRSWSTFLPTRMGGLDQMTSNVTSAGTASALTGRTPASPRAAALRRQRSRARSLTSSA